LNFNFFVFTACPCNRFLLIYSTYAQTSVNQSVAAISKTDETIIIFIIEVTDIANRNSVRRASRLESSYLQVRLYEGCARIPF
jgi:hypothetical protein